MVAWRSCSFDYTSDKGEGDESWVNNVDNVGASTSQNSSIWYPNWSQILFWTEALSLQVLRFTTAMCCMGEKYADNFWGNPLYIQGWCSLRGSSVFGVVIKGGNKGDDDEISYGGGNGIFFSIYVLLAMARPSSDTDSPVELQRGEIGR